jgi:hypothetical protein
MTYSETRGAAPGHAPDADGKRQIQINPDGDAGDINWNIKDE